MLALFFSSFLAATFLPFSSEAHLALLQSQGKAPLLLLAVATFGNTLGGMFTYGIGWLGKIEWASKWLGIKEDKVHKAKSQLNRFGIFLAFLCWLPIVGDVFAFVLGLAKANPIKVLFPMALGKMLRYGFIIFAVKEFF